ncbi:MAG: hypothetical protein M5R41_12755 [Bacteroidia bacterium]|nr:hypothetical protein [Bacteroidia bacterium]
MAKKIFLYTGIVSVIVLGVVILWRPAHVSENTRESRTPEEALELYLNDRMDYSLTFSRILAERRIRSAESLAVVRPDLRPLAREVIDSLNNRLARTGGS